MLTAAVIAVVLHAKPAPLKLDTLQAQVAAPAECEVSESFGSYSVECGAGEKIEYQLFVTEWLAKDPLQPKNPDGALESLKSMLDGAELKVLSKKEGNPAWTVTYVASTKASKSWGFQAVRAVGKKKLMCSGTANTEAQLATSLALCDGLKPLK